MSPRVAFPSATASVAREIEERLSEPRSIITFDEEISDPEAIELLIAGRPSAEQLSALPKLNTVLIPFAGVPKVTSEVLADRTDLALHNLHHNAAPTAEMAVALVLAAAKEVLPLDRKLRGGDWRPRYDFSAGTLLEGKTALVLGYGAIGRRVARICRAFGMNVTATRRGPVNANDETDADGVRVIATSAQSDWWPQAHFVLVTLPHTPETDRLLDAAALAALPDGAVVVNVGRAAIIEEAAFFDELASGRLRAGIDVWYQYPESEEERANTLPSKRPFHELDNVVLSPHRAGHTDAVDGLRADHLVDVIQRFVAGEPLPHRVDLARGY
ncbi:MAG: NAD(P)-dependent oxidoreductase [Planctomycetota bacterium]